MGQSVPFHKPIQDPKSGRGRRTGPCARFDHKAICDTVVGNITNEDFLFFGMLSNRLPYKHSAEKLFWSEKESMQGRHSHLQRSV